MTEAGYRQAYPKPESQKAALRRVIGSLAADVLVLQEMGGPPYLAELKRDLSAEGISYGYSAIADGADPDRQLAVLARRPLRDVASYSDLEFSYLGTRERVKRGLLEFTVDTPAGPVTVFAVHLKSRFTDRADDPLSTLRRNGEAMAVRDRILQRFPRPQSAQFILLGDFNDGRSSRALAAVQRRGRTEVADLLPASDSRGETWTHAFRREDTYSRVDHLLVSAALLSRVVGGRATIYDGGSVAEASDHRPVFLVLNFD